jgi:DNA-binding CsgD family transcriptional regulator
MLEAFALGAAADSPVAITLRDLSAPVQIQCADLEPVFGVTHGEHQVIVHLLQGRSSSEIAEQSGKSILTVRTHVKRAYGKIGVKTRGQLFARLLPYLLIR